MRLGLTARPASQACCSPKAASSRWSRLTPMSQLLMCQVSRECPHHSLQCYKGGGGGGCGWDPQLMRLRRASANVSAIGTGGKFSPGTAGVPSPSSPGFRCSSRMGPWTLSCLLLQCKVEYSTVLAVTLVCTCGV